MDLFAERGYGKTTARDIAVRAGLTERTFFNHFSDKREVLFAGSELFVKQVVDAVRATPKSIAPLDVVLSAYESTSDFFDARRPFARKRSALIAAHPELQERELIKMMSLAASITETLAERGTSQSAATLAAEVGRAIMHVAFEQWARDPRDRSLVFHLRAARRQLEAVVCGAKKRLRKGGSNP
jgi:AcrR family transcriptional regulator